MAVHTPLPLPAARSLAAHWNLDVAAVEGIPAGSVNSSYALTLAGGQRVFLRIYETRALASAAEEMRMLEHLASHGVPTPRPMPRADDPTSCVIDHGGKPVALFPWVGGEPVCQRMVTPERARRVGEALARVHLAGESLRDPLPDRFALPQLAERLAGIDARALPADLAATVDDLAARVEAQRAFPPFTENVLIHGDLFRDNVLWEGDSITALLDFESASWGSAAFDLMVTALAWCFGDALDHGLLRAMAAGYRAVRPLTCEERAELHRAAVVASLRFSVTRITDFELRPRGRGVFKDHRRFLARLRAVEASDGAAWPAALGL